LRKERNVTVSVSVDGEPIGMLPAIFKIYDNILNVKSEAPSAII